METKGNSILSKFSNGTGKWKFRVLWLVGATVCFGISAFLQFLIYSDTGNINNLIVGIIDTGLTIIIPGGIIDLFENEYKERTRDGTVEQSS